MAKIATQMDMKQEFVEMLRHTLGNEAQELCSVIADTEPSVSVRVNTAKGAHLPAGVQRVPWCEAPDFGTFFCH